jgi:hypothetical protein
MAPLCIIFIFYNTVNSSGSPQIRRLSAVECLIKACGKSEEIHRILKDDLAGGE